MSVVAILSGGDQRLAMANEFDEYIRISTSPFGAFRYGPSSLYGRYNDTIRFIGCERAKLIDLFKRLGAGVDLFQCRLPSVLDLPFYCLIKEVQDVVPSSISFLSFISQNILGLDHELAINYIKLHYNRLCLVIPHL